MKNFHSKTISELYKSLKSNPSGLSSSFAESRLRKYGLNKIESKKQKSAIITFLKQFNNALIYFLILAAVISYIFDHALDAYIIAFIILVNATIGFIQEFRAEKAINALQSLVVQKAKVIRDGKVFEVKAESLVPGDVILIEEGDNVPADARIITSKNLRAVESSLTGESYPVEKEVKKLSADTSLGDRVNMVWMGTQVVSGKAKALVVSTGTYTQLGLIAQDLKDIADERSHFEHKTDVLAKQMGLLAAFGGTVTFAVGYFFRDFEFFEIFMYTIAALVSAIPEGLPAVLVIVLAVGTSRMAQKNAIIRRLPATETLGVVDTILTDKTGTLTQNVMKVEKVVLFGQREVDVTGNGYIPIGNFIQNDNVLSPLNNENLLSLAQIAAVCNNSQIVRTDNEGYHTLGDPTELALLALAGKAGIDVDEVRAESKILDDLPFNSSCKFRATLFKKDSDASSELYAIGAPEALIKRSQSIMENGKCKVLTNDLVEGIHEEINGLTKQAMRVIAIAMKKDVKLSSISEGDVEEMCLVGLVAIFDPPRESVYEAIEKTKQAGIRVLMVTGDHKNTALAIGKQIGLVEHDSDLAYDQHELEAMNDKEFEEAIIQASVFARLTPDMKLKILSKLQDLGKTVAMTGDGVNDAPALKKADIGIAMGITGTDVARESSEMVLTDDNFASIVNAIEEGRLVFVNTKQTSTFMVTTNFAEIVTVVGSLLMGFPLILLPLQILWLNLVTSTVASLALIMEPSHHDLLEEPPRAKNENILGKDIAFHLFLMTVSMALMTIGSFVYFMKTTDDLDLARSGAFLAMAATQIYNLVNMRSLSKSIFKIGVFSSFYNNVGILASIILMLFVMYTPFMQGLFSLKDLGAVEFITICLLSSIVFWSAEGYKRVKG